MPHCTKRISTLIITLLLSLSTVLLQACSGDVFSALGEDTPRTEHTINSQFPTGQRMVSVILPKSYEESTNQRYPVLFHLGYDSDSFGMTYESIVELSSSGQIPEMIIVTLHHDEGNNRDDITPTVEGTRHNGQPERFLEHIEKEVVPLLEETYRVSEDRILAGWSRFGVFTTFALTEKPELFSGYIVRSSAPGGFSSLLQSKMQDMLSTTPDLSATFYFAVGTNGNESSRKEAFDNLSTLFTQDAPVTFRWHSEVINDAGHVGTFQPGLRNGLLFYFSEQ